MAPVHMESAKGSREKTELAQGVGPCFLLNQKVVGPVSYFRKIGDSIHLTVVRGEWCPGGVGDLARIYWENSVDGAAKSIVSFCPMLQRKELST